jgi:hypothetical protein
MNRNIVRAATVVTVIVGMVINPSGLMIELAVIGGVVVTFDAAWPLLKQAKKQWQKQRRFKNA